MSMMGSINDITSASTLRLDRRRQRPPMVSAARAAEAGLVGARRMVLGAASSDTNVLHFMLGDFRSGDFRSGDGVAGQGQEYVVEGGGVNGELEHGAALRIHFVEQGPYLRGAPVGRDADAQTGRVAPTRPRR